MPSLISHGFIGLVAGKLFTEKRMGVSFWLLSALCAIIPDADVVGFSFGVAYSNMFGHRGFSHSLVFALLLAGAVMLVGVRSVKRFSKEWFSLFGYFFVVTSSHGIFDAMTDGGLGVAFFAPFDSGRYFLPFRPIAVSPLSVRAFVSADGLSILLNEMLWIWFPMLLLLLIATAARRRRAAR